MNLNDVKYHYIRNLQEVVYGIDELEQQLREDCLEIKNFATREEK